MIYYNININLIRYNSTFLMMLTTLQYYVFMPTHLLGYYNYQAYF